MKLSPDVREQRKAEQLARLENKSSPDYPEMFAKQPRQIRRHAEQTAQRKSLRAAKQAMEQKLKSDAEGAVEVFGGTGQISAAVGISVDAGQTDAPEA